MHCDEVATFVDCIRLRRLKSQPLSCGDRSPNNQNLIHVVKTAVVIAAHEDTALGLVAIRDLHLESHAPEVAGSSCKINLHKPIEHVWAVDARQINWIDVGVP